MKRINILHVYCALPIGGAERLALTLARNLKDDRFNLVFCCLRCEGEIADEIRKVGNPVINLGIRRKRYDLWLLIKLLRLIKKENIHIIHTHLYEAGIRGRIVAKVAGVPGIIATEHGPALWKKKWQIVLERIVTKATTDLKIANSEYIRQSRIHKEKIAPEKIITIYNGVEPPLPNSSADPSGLEELGLPMSGLIIGTVARLTEAKGLQYLIESMPLILSHIPNAHLIVVGDGPCRLQLEAMRRDLHIEQSVTFTGRRMDVFRFVEAMDVFVLPSIREAMGIAIVEAMFAAKPIVASNVGGIPELVLDGKTGLLVPPRDPKALADKIVYLLLHSSEREQMGKMGQDRADAHFSADRYVESLKDAYLDCLETKGLIRREI